ncbi:MAG: Hpt domain-containing protein [Planctomycetia bacterium]|nr:Hpt domain-containing protein [Planctomycetia bacterium]
MTLSVTQDEPPLSYSTLADDSDLAEIVEMFVHEMPDRVSNLLRRFESRDLPELERAAHQLKGAAGSYGFHQLTPAAARLEATLKQRRPEEEILAALDGLVTLCRGVRSGAGA